VDYNKCVFVGKIASDFNVVDRGGKKQVFFTFKINSRRPDQNGQYVDNFTEIPMYAEDRTVDTLVQNVVTGQELLVECQYVAWTDEGGQSHHIFKYGWASFGFKPRDQAAPQRQSDGPPI